MQHRSYATISKREHYQWLQYTPMLSPSHPIVTTSLTKWTSSLPDSLVNRFPKLEIEKVQPMTDGSGLPSSTSFAKHHPPSSSWRTSQTSLTNMGHLVKYSQPWPRSGSMLNGRLFKHPKSVQTIKEIVYSSSPTDLNISTFLPTPTASDGSRGSTSYGPGNLTLKGAAINISHQTLPTPTASDVFKHPTGGLHRRFVQGRKTSHQPNTQSILHGGINKPRLSPLFVEWMMGFKTGWTDLEPSETQ